MNKLFSKIAALSVGLTMAIGVGVAVGSKGARVVRAGEPDTDKYQKITSVSGLAAGDKAVLYNPTDSEGVTGTSGTKDASTASTGWLEYEVAKTATGFTLQADTNSYVTLGSKSFSHSATATDLSVTSNGYLCTVADSDNILYRQSTYVRTYTGKSGDSNFHPFAVYKVLNSTPTQTYTITYNANGGSGTMSPTTGSNPAVAACTFTAPNGKVFSKWNTAANGSGTDYAAGDKPGNDLSLYAIWAVSESVLIEASSTDQLSISPWSVNNNPTGIETTSYSRGWQWGGGTSAVITYTSSQAFKKVVVGASTNGASTSLAVAVGGVAFGDSQSVTSGTAAARTDYTFEGTGEGNVVITLTNTASKSAYINKIELFFDDGPDPSKDTLVVKLNDTTLSPQTLTYSSTTTWLFYADDKDGNNINSEWESSDPSIFSVTKNGNNVAVVTPHKGGTATLTASHENYNSGSFVLTVDVGTVATVTVSGSMTKTSYYVGESWSHDGLVATASYSTGYEGDVSSEAVWTYSAETPVVAVTSLVVTATFGGVSGNSAAQAVTVSRTNPIQVLYTLADKASVTDIYGVYVGKIDSSNIVIMDGEYGIDIYSKNAFETITYTENETILKVSGSISIYNGFYEILPTSLTVETSVPSDKVPSTPVVYAAKGGETYEYVSRLTTVTGTFTVASGSQGNFDGDFDPDNKKDITMTFDLGGGKTLPVFYHRNSQTEEVYNAMKAAVTGGTEITVKGFTAWYNSAIQIKMNGYIPPAEGYTAEDFAQDLLDQTDAVCEGWTEGKNNHDALEIIWSNLASNDKYPSLPSDQKTILAEAERDESGTVVEQAMARYDFLTGKYNLSNFINGRNPIVPAGTMYADDLTSINSTMVVIVVIASISVLAFTTLLVFKKNKRK